MDRESRRQQKGAAFFAAPFIRSVQISGKKLGFPYSIRGLKDLHARD